MSTKRRWAFMGIGGAAAAAAFVVFVIACSVNESITAPGESRPPFWLWNADAGENYVFKINPASGGVVASFTMPFTHQGYAVSTGLTYGGGYFWHTYAKRGEEKAKLWKMHVREATFSVIRSWDLTYDEPTGLAWEKGDKGEDYLWSAGAGETPQIYKVYVKTGSIEINNPFASPALSPGGLAWDGKYLWVADKEDGLLYKINPAALGAIASFPSPGPNPTGLAWDGAYLWNADEYTDLIYKIEPKDKSIAIVDHIEAPGYSPRGLAVQGRF